MCFICVSFEPFRISLSKPVFLCCVVRDATVPFVKLFVEAIND